MNKHTKRLILIGIILAIVLFWIPTPYVIIQPGSAEVVNSMVEIDEGYMDEKGTLMLTTVRMTYSNAATYLKSYFDAYADIRLKTDVFRQGETRQEYSERQEYNMVSSQSNAVQAAYLKADIPFEVTTEVLITGTLEDMPAENILKTGDRLLTLNNKKVDNIAELIETVKQKKIGDTVTFTYLRNDEEKTADIQIGETADAQPAIGVYLANLHTVKALDEGKQVHITAGDIGGPSAGLIFALEIYNRLVPEDITKGYQIAGTGEITPLGLVGAIGGVNYKVVAADRAGAEIFFTPEDNSKLANEQASNIGTDMQIITVATIDEALAYLEALPPK
jgi:PDZ domain-containing protein